jgi:hypothetical protein
VEQKVQSRLDGGLFGGQVANGSPDARNMVLGRPDETQGVGLAEVNEVGRVYDLGTGGYVQDFS